MSLSTPEALVSTAPRLVSVVALAAFVTGCGGSATPSSAPAASPSRSASQSATPGAGTSASGAVPSTSAGSSAAPAADAVAFGTALGKIRGHLYVAQTLYGAGDQPGALAHAALPLEVLPLVKSEIVSLGGDATGVEAALKHVVDAITAKAPANQVSAAITAVEGLIADAEVSVVGPTSATPAYRGSVVASLLAAVAGEYEEAFADGTIKEPDKYREGFGFLHAAEGIYITLEPAVRSTNPHEADQITAALAILDKALPAATPPATVTPLKDVQAATAAIGHELEDSVHALPVNASDPKVVVADIGRLLDEMLTAYRAGKADPAADIAAEAYLEHYELIEGSVLAKAPAINAELEPLLAAMLRQKMREGAPVADVEQLVARAKKLLADALVVLEAAH